MKQKPKGAEEGDELTGNGIGERLDFLTQDNHIFINKLNYMCKNYDSSFKDVSICCNLVVTNLLMLFSARN